MDEMVYKVCTVCGVICETGRCDRHKRRDERPSASRRGYNHRWRILRARFLRRFPVCWMCGGVASEVHHRNYDPLGPPDDRTWMSLCGTCHRRVTAEDNNRK